MPNRFWIRYLRRFLATALTRSLGPIDLWAGLGAAVLSVFDHYLPEAQLATTFAWQIPIFALAAVMAMRLVLSPYWITREDAKKLSEANAELAELNAAGISVEGIDVYEHPSPWLTGQTFVELDIRNTSAKELNNCHAYVADIKRASIPPELLRELPIPLRTSTNIARGDGGPFILRPGQPKKITLGYTTKNEEGQPVIAIIHADDDPRFLYGITECEFIIDIYGSAKPTTVSLALYIDGAARVRAEFNEPCGISRRFLHVACRGRGG